MIDAYTYSDLGAGVSLNDWLLPSLRIARGPGSEPLPVGEYEIEWFWPYVEDPLEHPYYDLTYKPGTLFVAPRPVEVEIHDHTRYYGLASPNSAYGYTI